MYCRNFPLRAVVTALIVTLVTACGGGGGGGGSLPAPPIVADSPPLNSLPTPPAVGNALAVTVDAGPANSGYNVNRLYASVTICHPGSITQCQTIDHVLVDTGSTGLRLLSEVMAPALNLSRLTSATGLPLLNCAQFVDNSFAWGSVATADVVLGGKTAARVPIQIIADPASKSPTTACSVGATAITTTATLGANGILGLGLFTEDCGTWCTTRTANGFYFTCTDTTCSAIVGTTASLDKQVKNPVPLFATDNNGILVNLPAAGPVGAISLEGSLIFGIGTQANNQFTSAALVSTSSAGNVGTVLAGKTLSASFIDTGSNGLFFDSAAIPVCVGNAIGFYCPASLTTLSATLLGPNAVTIPVSFPVDNALAMLTLPPKSVLPALAGPIGDPNIFDWGLPFFYGRRVFIGIEGLASPLGTGPLYAF